MTRSNVPTSSRKRDYLLIGGRPIPKKRGRVFLFIVNYKEENDGRNPTYQEIADSCGCTVSTAYIHVSMLVTMDSLLKFMPNRAFDLGGKYEPPENIKE